MLMQKKKIDNAAVVQNILNTFPLQMVRPDIKMNFHLIDVFCGKGAFKSQGSKYILSPSALINSKNNQHLLYNTIL